MIPTYYARVWPDGRLETKCQALAGKEVVIVARKAKRSHKANARYWALLTVAAREIGYDTAEELHESIAMHLLRLPEKIPGVPRRRRTPKLNTKDFSEYCEACERYFRMELGCDLSDWDRMTEIGERE